MRRLFLLLAAIVLLASCVTRVEVPMDVEIPEIPPMPEGVGDEDILTGDEIQDVHDLAHNLLVYEGQAQYWESVAGSLLGYIESLASLSPE